MGQTFYNVSFNELSDVIFVDQLTDDSVEQYWYAGAWAVLEKAGLTQYSNSLEEGIVYLRAGALSMILKDALDAMDIHGSISRCISSFMDIDVPTECWYVIYGIMIQKGEIEADYELGNFDELILGLINVVRPSVYNLLKDNWSVAKICASIYSVVYPPETAKYIDPWGREHKIPEFETNNGFWALIDRDLSSILDAAAQSNDGIDLYQWLEEGAYSRG